MTCLPDPATEGDTVECRAEGMQPDEQFYWDVMLDDDTDDTVPGWPCRASASRARAGGDGAKQEGDGTRVVLPGFDRHAPVIRFTGSSAVWPGLSRGTLHWCIKLEAYRAAAA
jgi:hypothetical protein